MKIQLNGWQRLWVIVSVVYLLPVVVLTIILCPSPETTWHREEFIRRMPVELQKKIEGAYDSNWNWEEAQKKRNAIPAEVTTKSQQSKSAPPPDFVLASAPVEFANRAVLQVRVAKPGDTEPDARVTRAYWAVIKKAAVTAQWQSAGFMALAWTVPCVVLYALAGR